jgi:hypothetical protein
MAERSAESEDRSQPAWASLGCLVVLLGVTFFVAFVLASCTPEPKANGRVIVDDRANLLAQDTKAAIERIKFPQEIAAVVRTVTTIPRTEIGTFASELMSEEPHWHTLRPRGWLRRHLRQDLPWGPGVYVLVSSDPQLLQIRFGRDIRLSAYQHMLAIGPWYRSQQRFDRSALDQHVVSTVTELAARTRRLTDPPWPLSWAQYLASMVASEIDDVLAPSDGLFSNLALRRYIVLAHSVGATGSAWRFVAFSVGGFVLLWLIGKKLLIDRLVLPRTGNLWLRGSLVILSNLGLLGVLVTSFAALAALSQGRVEDQLALEAMGLSFLSATGFDATLFAHRGGLWVALPGAFVSFVGEAVQAAEAQRHGEMRIPYGWVGWGCLLFLLPKAIAIAALAMLIWKTGADIVQSVRRSSA